MTWQGVYAAPRSKAAHRATVLDVLLFSGAVLLFFIYTQGWATALLGQNSEGIAAGATNEGPILRVIFFPAYLAGLGLLIMSLPKATIATMRQPLLALLVLVAAASIFWSIDPPQTLRRIVAITFTTLGGVAIASRYSWARLAELMATAFAPLILGSLVVIFFVPSFGRMDAIFPGAWRGLWAEKNALGGNMVFGFVICASAAIFEPKRRWLWIGMSLGALLLVLGSTSKTSLVALLLGVAAMAFVCVVRRGPVTAVGATWLAVLGTIMLACALIFASDVFFHVLGKDATLTGRTRIWAGVLREIQERPWLGFGYGAVWDDKSGWGPVYWISKWAAFRAGHSHNSWLQIWLELGVVGAAVWALLFLSTLLRAIVAIYRDPGAYMAFPLVLVFMLMSLTETIALVYNDFRWVVFVAMAIKLAVPDRDGPRR